MPVCECRCITRCRRVRRRSDFLSRGRRGHRGRRHWLNVLFFCVHLAVKRRLCVRAKPGCGGATFPGHTTNRGWRWGGTEGEESRGGWGGQADPLHIHRTDTGSDSAPVWSTDSTFSDVLPLQAVLSRRGFSCLAAQQEEEQGGRTSPRTSPRS